MTLAFDLGTLVGWARGRRDGPVTYGTLDLTGNRFEGGGMRFVRFQNALAELLGDELVNRVAYEEVRKHLGTDAAHIYGALQGILTAECERRSIPYEGIPIGTWKKAAVGKGNANKAVVLAAARTQYGDDRISQDEADALFLLHYALSRNGQPKGG